MIIHQARNYAQNTLLVHLWREFLAPHEEDKDRQRQPLISDVDKTM